MLPQLLRQISAWSDGITLQIAALGHVLNSGPALLHWGRRIASDPDTPRAVLTGGAQLGAVLGLAILVQWIIARLLRPTRARLARHAETKTHAPEAPPTLALRRLWRPVRLLPLALMRLVLDLLPIAGFALVGNLLPSLILEPYSLVQPAILALVNACIIFAVVMAITRMLASPDAPGLRLLQIPESGADYIVHWMRWLAGIAIFGLAVAGLAALWGMHEHAYLALQKTVVLIDHIFLVVIVLQCRREIAARLQPRRGATGRLANTLHAFAGVWHYIAIFFIIGLWLVWAADLRDGYVRLWHIAVVTCAVLGAARLLAALLLSGLEHCSARHPGRCPALSGCRPGHPAIITSCAPAFRRRWPVSALLLLLELWGVSAFGWFSHNPIGQQLISALISIGVTILIAVAVWEVANAAIDRHLDHLTREAQLGRAARMRTILPILRTGLLVTVLIVAGLTTLDRSA